MITHANKFDIRNLNFANMMQRSFIMIAVFFSLISTSWAATTYYVSNSGNDANIGTSVNTPFKTIQKAMGKVLPGDTVWCALAPIVKKYPPTVAAPLTITSRFPAMKMKCLSSRALKS